MITTLVAIAVFIAFALKEAHEDRKGKPVDAHAPDWVDRATFAFVVAVCCAYANIYTTDATVWGFLWKLLGFGLIAYGLFTPVFRWRLNRLRGMDARYVSPSSAYDWFFIWCAMPAPKEGGKLWHLFSHDTIGGARMKHAELYSSNLDFWTRIHRAGFIAYLVEGLALLIGCAITLELWK